MVRPNIQDSTNVVVVLDESTKVTTRTRSHERVTTVNYLDADNRPAGGEAAGKGLAVRFQNGPLREQGSDDPAEPNGCFVEDLLRVVLDRLDTYQATQFACDENAAAIRFGAMALEALESRTKRRVDAGTEGTHEGN